MRLSDWIRTKQQRAGLNQSEAARLAGVSHAAFWQWVQGSTKPRLPALLNFCDGVGASPRERAWAVETLAGREVEYPAEAA